MEFIPVAAEDAKAPNPDPVPNIVLDPVLDPVLEPVPNIVPNIVLEPVLDSVVEPVPNVVVDPKTTIFTLMHKLEQDALDKVLSIHKTVETKKTEKPSDLGDLLMQIMEQGAQEFKRETGRNMSYAEMRYMYG